MVITCMAVAIIVCLIGWFNRYVNTCALIYYMTEKKYTLPTENELKECTLYVVKHLIKK